MFLGPAALYKYVQPDKTLVFILEILFCEDHEKQYITLIKAKYGFTENNKQYELLKEDLKEKKLKKVTIDRKSEEIYEELIKEFPKFVEMKEFLIHKLIPLFNRLKEFRNKFAHGMIIKDSIIKLGLISKWIELNNKPLNLISRSEIESLSKEGIQILIELYNYIIRYYKSIANEIENIVSKYLDEIEKSYEEFRKYFRFRY